jgi:hypothetical protein
MTTLHTPTPDITRLLPYNYERFAGYHLLMQNNVDEICSCV